MERRERDGGKEGRPAMGMKAVLNEGMMGECVGTGVRVRARVKDRIKEKR